MANLASYIHHSYFDFKMTGKNYTATTIQLIKDFEGFRSTAYRDGNAYSIGYGAQTYENGQPVKVGDTITQQRAEQLLAFHVSKFAAAVNQYINVALNQNQFDALVSFCYNVGISAFSTSTLAKIVNKTPNDFDSISREFRRWNKSNGVVLQGLIDRREQEILVYVQGTYEKKNYLLILVVAAAVSWYILR